MAAITGAALSSTAAQSMVTVDPSMTAAPNNVVKKQEKVTEDVLDDDGHEEFSRRSSGVAMEGYDKIVREVAEQVRLMTLEEGVLTAFKCDGDAAESGRLNGCLKLFRQVEKTVGDTNDLIVRVNVAISACKSKIHHDAKKLQDKMNALQDGDPQNGGKGFKQHTKIFTDFSNAFATTCYNYLAQRGQTYKVQYFLWKVTPSSMILPYIQQYASYSNIERVMQAAVLEPECGGDGPSGPDTAAATAVTKDSKQSEPNSPTSPTSPTSSPTSTVELASNAAVPTSPVSNAAAKTDGTTNAKQPEATSPASASAKTDVAIAITSEQASSVSSIAVNTVVAATTPQAPNSATNTVSAETPQTASSAANTVVAGVTSQTSSSAANTVSAETPQTASANTDAETSGSQLAAGIPTS